MKLSFQLFLDSIMASTPCRPRGPGLSPRVGDESISKNWRFLFISKDKWFVNAAHLSEFWDLYLYLIQALFPMLPESDFSREICFQQHWKEPESDFSREICFQQHRKQGLVNIIVLSQQKLWFLHRIQKHVPNKGNCISSIENTERFSPSLKFTIRSNLKLKLLPFSHSDWP